MWCSFCRLLRSHGLFILLCSDYGVELNVMLWPHCLAAAASGRGVPFKWICEQLQVTFASCKILLLAQAAHLTSTFDQQGRTGAPRRLQAQPRRALSILTLEGSTRQHV